MNRASTFGERRLLSQHRKALLTTAEHHSGFDLVRRHGFRVTAHLAVVVFLLGLAAANLHLRWTWSELEDGVLWTETAGSITARQVLPDSPAARADIRAGDVLIAIDGRDVVAIGDVWSALHEADGDARLTYSVLRDGERSIVHVPLEAVPTGSLASYFVLASVGIFALLVGAVVRLRRPDNQATLHFFWLTVAFFGVLSLSFAGRLDPLDQVFYWGDVIAMLLLPPLFLHFALMFPERPDSWVRTEAGRTLLPLLYLPALLLGGARVAVMLRGRQPGRAC